MHQLYQTYPSSSLKINPAEAFEMADKGPVVIMARAKQRAVMVSPQIWNQTALKIEQLEQELRNRTGDVKLAILRHTNREPFTRQEMGAFFNEDATRE